MVYYWPSGKLAGGPGLLTSLAPGQEEGHAAQGPHQSMTLHREGHPIIAGGVRGYEAAQG